jgi:hypothetical protein
VDGSRQQKGSGRVKSVSFSADPTFIEKVKVQIGHRSLSSFIVEALEEKLVRLRSDDGVIKIGQRVGTLLQPLEFVGRWIVPPENALMTDDGCGTSDCQATADERGCQPQQRTWWAAAITDEGSFVWLSSASPDGIQNGRFFLQVQGREEVAFGAFFGVPQPIYEQVRRIAPPLPAKRIQ